MHSVIRHTIIATQQGEHLHNYSQVLIGWRGRMGCELPHASNALSCGAFALAPQDVPHYYSGHTEDCELLVVDMFQDDPVQRFLAEHAALDINDLFQHGAAFARLPEATLPVLEYCAQHLQSASQAQQQRLNMQMLPMLLLQVADAMTEQDGLWRTVAHQRLDIVELHRLIDRQPERTLSNEWLAHYFNMSPSHFYVVCQTRLGMAPQQYIMRRKLMQARQLLITTHLPMAVLANQFGFSCSSAFSRAYRKQMGISPRQERSRVQH